MRLALLTEIPAPYRLPLFRALAEEVDLRVLFLARADPRRGYPAAAGELGFPSEVLPGRGLVRGGAWVVVSRAVVRRLERLRPDVVVVGGWNQPAFWEALAWARARRRPLVTWVESTRRDERSRWTGAPKRAFARASAAFLVPGRAAADYVRSLGVGDDRIVVAPNAVDNGRFGPGRGQARVVSRTDRVRLLYVGRLAPEKGLDVLFRAIEGLPVELSLAGAGSVAAPPGVRRLGQLTQDEVAAAYASADVFVLPSLSEPWGMVLNEAAAAGLPLVATDACGAAHELIEEGRNGFRVPAGDAGALRAAIQRLAGDAELRAAFGARSRDVAARFTPEAWAAAVAALVRRYA